jgi:invasion protein IalB
MLSDLEGLTVIPFQLTLPSGVKLDIDYKETTSEEQNQHTTQVIHKALGSVIERLNEHIDSVQ